MEWIDNQLEKPLKDGKYRVMNSFGEATPLEFKSGRWLGMADQDIVAWVDEHRSPSVDSIIVEELPDMTADDFYRLPAGADPAADAIISLMKREVGNVSVEFVVYKVAEDANTSVSGRVVATSENYAAQHAGGRNIVLHDRNALARDVRPGEEVTIVYRNGFADVLDGQVVVADVKINADGLKSEEIVFMEQMIRSYLGNGLVAAKQDDLDNAAEVAYGMAAQEFGLAKHPGMLTVSRVDLVQESQARTLAKVQEWEPKLASVTKVTSSMIKPFQP